MGMPEWVQILMGIVAIGASAGGGAVAAYVAIRADLAEIRASVRYQEGSILRAHERIDDLSMSFRRG